MLPSYIPYISQFIGHHFCVVHVILTADQSNVIVDTAQVSITFFTLHFIYVSLSVCFDLSIFKRYSWYCTGKYNPFLHYILFTSVYRSVLICPFYLSIFVCLGYFWCLFEQMVSPSVSCLLVFVVRCLFYAYIICKVHLSGRCLMGSKKRSP